MAHGINKKKAARRNDILVNIYSRQGITWGDGGVTVVVLLTG